jgi:predicted dehydrogenase
LAVIGLGGLNVVGGVGGRGRQLIDALVDVPGTRVAAICDVDESLLRHEVERFRRRGQSVKTHADLRRVFDDPDIDAVLIATPNHWHALATVWACEAGKDVYVEKPFSHNLWEGRQMIAAADRYGRMIQVGTQRRSSEIWPQVFEFLGRGELGTIRVAHAVIYRARDGIGKVTSPTSIPQSVDYDLWCGPVAKTPLMRKQLHYEWHWLWATGNGEIGNNGIHTIDVARWALNQDGPPPRAMSVGGRYGFDDAGETPNTQVAIMDYQPVPLICEIRNWRVGRGAAAMGRYRGTEKGLVIDCQGGYCKEDSSGITVFDERGKKIREFPAVGAGKTTTVAHLANFVDAVRSRDETILNAGPQVGHDSAACFHLANLSHRLGSLASFDDIAASDKSEPAWSDAIDRCVEYLASNGLKLDQSRITNGPWVQYDANRDQLSGQWAERANELSRTAYREPFVVPRLAAEG